MRYRDTLLFATTGWDPTWERQLSATARSVWAVAVSLLSAIFGAAALLAWLHLPEERRWMPIALAGLWLVTVGGVQVLVRREVLRRVEVEADQIAARQIHARLLPAELPRAPGFDLAASYSPLREIGGDFYEVAPIDGGRWLVAMADVSGKGAGAALLTDGLPERANRADDFFGEERILSSLSQGGGGTAGDILRRLIGEADRFARGVQPADDIALLVLRSC